MMRKNLCTDPWIPVSLADGGTALLGLEELFARLGEIRDLVLSPRERIAVMRLLICITQRALDGPEDADAREECRGEIIPESLAYLQRWRKAFDMTGENGAFLQVPELQGREIQSVSKLDMTLASGNNSTLFDNAGGSRRRIDFSRVALSLLSFQNFSPGSTIGVAEWAGNPTAPKAPDSCKGGPCVAGSALHLFLVGKNLLETLWMNLVPKDSIPKSLTFGKPVWEQMPGSMRDKPAIDNATLTYLGRLVPVSRSIRLLGTELEEMILARGLTYPDEDDHQSILYYESTTRRKRGKDGRISLVRTSLGCALWRSLPAMLRSFQEENSSEGSPYDNDCLPECFDIWVGALVVDKANIMGEIESRFPHVPPDIFSEATTVKLRDSLIKADQGDKRLHKAICHYHELMGEPLEQAQKKAQRELVINRAMEIYWGQLSSFQNLFLATAMEQSEEADKKWRTLINRSCRTAYDIMCPHTTDRQLEAWARGWKTYSKSLI